MKREEGTFSRIQVTLGRGGSLAPLFLSFGLITPEQAEWVNLNHSTTDGNGHGVSLIEWLKEVLSEASSASRQYDMVKQQNNMIRDELEEKYGLDSIDPVA